MLKVTFGHTSYPTGGDVTASFEAFGTVAIESELRRASWTEEVTGQAEVSLGAATGPGMYAVRASIDEDRYAATIALLPGAGGRLESKILDLSGVARPAAVDAGVVALLARFNKSLTTARLQAGLSAAWGPWAGANGVAIGSTVVVCLIPGFQAACAVAAAGNLVDLAVVALTKTIEEMVRAGLFTAAEGRLLGQLFGITGTVVQMALPGAAIERLAALGSGVLDLTLSTEAAKLEAKVATDFAKKYYFILKLKSL